MPDNTHQEPSSGGSGREPGGRRSGLDRLRAARGETSAGAPGESPSEDAGARGNGSTAVLESPAADSRESSPAPEREAEPKKKERGRRLRRRSGSAASADAATGQ